MKAKSFPLTRTVIKSKYQIQQVALLGSAIAEKDEVSCHGNATQNSKPFRTSKDVLRKAGKKCVNWLNVKTVYDEINKESGGAYDFSSQRNELRNTRQVNRQSEKAKMTKGMGIPEFSAKLSTTTMLQRSDPEFIKTISCIRDSYYIFLGTTIQLDDVVKMCCDSDNVQCIDTTFNLCSSWITDCCYNNDRLRTNEGKH